MVLVGRIETQNVHVESGALLDQGKTDAPGANDGYGFSGDFVAQKRQVRMPVTPAILTGQMFGGPELPGQRPHQEESKLGGRFREHVGGMGERNSVAVGVGAIDVVKSDRNLCHHFERAFSGSEHLGVDRIAQGRDQAVRARLQLFDDQTLWRSFGLGIDFEVVSLVAKNVEGVSDVAGRKNADSMAHGLQQCIAAPKLPGGAPARPPHGRPIARRARRPSLHHRSAVALSFVSFRSSGRRRCLRMMPHIGAKNPEDYVLGNVGGVVRDALQITRYQKRI